MAVTFEAAAKTPHFVTIRNHAGALVRCIASAAGASGERTVMWSGKDSAGREAPAGRYRVSVSRGVTWKLDTGFGKGGRIGRYVTEEVIRDPAAPIRVDGVLDRTLFSGILNYAYPDLWPNAGWPVAIWIDQLTVNGAPCMRAADCTGTDTSFTFRDGTVRLNPAGIHPGDTVKVVSYDTCFLNNPWDLALGDDGSLYVLVRCATQYHGYYWSSLIKLTADGRKVDASFGARGEIPCIMASNQVVLSPEENRIYIAGSHWYSWGTGSFKMHSGAFWFYLGGSGDDPAATYLPGGVCLGRDNKIYIGDLKVYDRTRRNREGFLYPTTVTAGTVRPGPSMERAPEDDMFYMTGWSTGISKMRDTGTDVTEAYALALPFKTIGISLDPARRLLFAGSRDTEGRVAVLYDDGVSLREVAQLEDDALGGIHTVRVHEGRLYVVEDGAAFTAEGRNAVESGQPAATPVGRNRISRYTLTFGRERELGEIEKE